MQNLYNSQNNIEEEKQIGRLNFYLIWSLVIKLH